MVNGITVPNALLRDALEVLLRHVEEVQGAATEVEVDFFWSIPPDQLCDMTSEPSGHTVGQISECLSNLEGLVAEPEQAVAYGLVWLADVLRVVGQAVVR